MLQCIRTLHKTNRKPLVNEKPFNARMLSEPAFYASITSKLPQRMLVVAFIHCGSALFFTGQEPTAAYEKPQKKASPNDSGKA
jgi:hypothetical protein